MTEPNEFAPADLERRYRVTDRTLRAWVKRGWLPRPRKLGPFVQSRVRWTAEDLKVLDARLAAAAAQQKAA